MKSDKNKIEELTNKIVEMTTFMNVDLDIYSKSDLQPLVMAWGLTVATCYMGREGRFYSAHLELAVPPKSADTAIRRFAVLVNRLPKAERKLWDMAKVRDFNVGVQAAWEPLSNETIGLATALKARIVFTIYAAQWPKSVKRLSNKASPSRYSLTRPRL